MFDSVLPHILAQHAGEAADLWEQRSVLFDLPHVRLKDIADHDHRVEAHIDGLRIAGDAAWPILRREGNFEEPGQVFAATLLALERGKDDRIQEMIRAGTVGKEHRRGLIGAFAWLPADKAMRHILPLHAGDTAALRFVGLSASIAHRQHPGIPLERGLNDSQNRLRARACRGVGELAAQELMGVVRTQLASDDPNVRYAAAWTLALRAGDTAAINHLRDVAVNEADPNRGEAFHVAVRRLGPAARSWLAPLMSVPGCERLTIRGLGLIGDPHDIPALMRHMSNPAFARLAGEAFTFITGADLAQEYLKLDEDPKLPEPPEDSPATDPDDNLPWPDPERVRKWWDKNKERFANGTRHLLGKPLSPDWLKQVLKIGKQRHRVAAAIEQAIREPNRPLFNWQQPGFRQ